MDETEQKLIYLYCIAKTKPLNSFEETGIKTYHVYFQGTYAVVSKVSPDEFSKDNLEKNLGDMKWLGEKVRQHERIIERVMQDTTVIPFKFGTVFLNEENVEKLVKEKEQEFKRIIADLEGKEEWGLKVYCALERFRNAARTEDERLKEKEGEIASAGAGKAFFLKKKKDGLEKDIINERVSEYTKDCFERLKRTSLETKINKILPKEVTEKKNDMILNAVFLINKKRIKEFESVTEYLRTKYSVKGLDLDCTGPWPPYNFCP